MRLFVITVDGKVMQSNVLIEKNKLTSVISKLVSLWWVSEVYPIS